jgi:hypothetical protein
MQAFRRHPTVYNKPDPAKTTSDTGDAPVKLEELLKQERPTTVADAIPEPVKEFGGRKDGPEPTRYGDWEKNGRCIDF